VVEIDEPNRTEKKNGWLALVSIPSAACPELGRRAEESIQTAPCGLLVLRSVSGQPKLFSLFVIFGLHRLDCGGFYLFCFCNTANLFDLDFCPGNRIFSTR